MKKTIKLGVVIIMCFLSLLLTTKNNFAHTVQITSFDAGGAVAEFFQNHNVTFNLTLPFYSKISSATLNLSGGLGAFAQLQGDTCQNLPGIFHEQHSLVVDNSTLFNDCSPQFPGSAYVLNNNGDYLTFNISSQYSGILGGKTIEGKMSSGCDLTGGYQCIYDAHLSSSATMGFTFCEGFTRASGSICPSGESDLCLYQCMAPSALNDTLYVKITKTGGQDTEPLKDSAWIKTYPENFMLFVNEELIFNQLGEYNISNITNGFSLPLNNALGACNPVGNNCTIKFRFNSNFTGGIVSKPNLTVIVDHIPIVIDTTPLRNNIQINSSFNVSVYVNYTFQLPSVNLTLLSSNGTIVINNKNMTCNSLTTNQSLCFSETIKTSAILEDLGNWSFNITAFEIDYSHSDLTFGNVSVVGCIDYNLSVCEFQLLSTNQTSVIFEFVIKNNLNQSLYGINWTFNTGDNVIINSTLLANLSSGEDLYNILQYNYTASGNYTATVTAKAGSFITNNTMYLTI